MAFSEIELKRIEDAVGGFCHRRNRPELQDLLWHAYEPLAASRSLEELVAEVDRDHYGCFFG